MVFGGSAVNSVNTCKSYVQVRLCSQWQVPYSRLLFYRNDRFPGGIYEHAFAVRKGIPHKNVHLPPLVLMGTTVVLYRLVVLKCYLQLSISHQATDVMM
jgi:hypothetical protein